VCLLASFLRVYGVWVGLGFGAGVWVGLGLGRGLGRGRFRTHRCGGKMLRWNPLAQVGRRRLTGRGLFLTHLVPT